MTGQQKYELAGIRHVDPASPAFTNLPREEQARIYRYHYGWKVKGLAEEFGVSVAAIDLWTNPGAKEKHKAARRARLKTDEGRQIRNAAVRRYRAKRRAQEGSKRKLTPKQREELRQLYRERALNVDLAHWFKVSDSTISYHTRDIRRPRTYRACDYERVVRLFQSGLNQTAISKRLGVGRATVQRAVLAVEKAA